ncbi:hypothetical protein [Streptacidiphilus sp. MAP5-3]|uniref:hypothetical protein n=1 Tax=unclassified Streptacidiphilus TaxID=2643834 RepID=UPI003513CD38
MSPRQGGDSYPSGTPPYGVPGDPFSRAGQTPGAGQSGQPGHAGSGQPAPSGEEPRTETTLTTRIKINIPGSRPIPPVVVRSPISEDTGEQPAPRRHRAEDTDEQAVPRRHRADSSGSPVLGVMDSGQGTAPPPDLPAEWRTPDQAAPAQDSQSQSTSEWFAPRKKSSPPPPPAAPAAPAPPAQSGPPAPPAPPWQTQEFQAPPQQTQSPSQTTAQGPLPTAPAGPLPNPQQTGEQPLPQRPSKGKQQPQQPARTLQFPTADLQQQSPLGYDTQSSTPWAQGPGQGPGQGSGQGPAQASTGSQTLPPRPVPNAGRPRGSQGFGTGSGIGGEPGPMSGPIGAGPSADRPGVVGGAEGGIPRTLQFPSLTDPQAPAGFGAVAPPVGPGAPAPAQPDAQPKPSKQRKQKRGGQNSQTGQNPQGGPGGQSAAEQTAAMPAFRPVTDAGGRPSGDGFAGGTGGAGAPPRPEPSADGSGGAATGSASPKAGSSAKAAAPAKKRGGGKVRKLAGTGIGAVVVLGAVAYGAGLMLNQTDVPKGTTVLGQSIGGDTRDQAVTALDGSLGKLAAQPIQVTIGGRATTLNPSVAGLTIDTGATVQNVAQHSYNPVTVVESIWSGSKAVAPVVVIDEDKLRSALQQLGGSGAVGAQPYVHFSSSGKVEVSLPKASGSALDVNAAVPLVEQAFRSRAAGHPDQVVALPTTTGASSGDPAAAQQAAQTLGAWAMKQSFKVVAGGSPVLFGKNTFSHALTLRPNASGQFTPVFNLTELANAYGTAFVGVNLKNGQPVTPEAVAAALTSLLSSPGGATSTSI